MTQQFNMNHGHPDADLLTSILACERFLETKNHYTNTYTDWTSWNREWNARAGCHPRVGLGLAKDVQ